MQRNNKLLTKRETFKKRSYLAYLLILFINFYQVLLSPLLKAILGQQKFCRYSKTCSMYAKEVVLEFGALKGSRMAIFRLLTCSPLSKGY